MIFLGLYIIYPSFNWLMVSFFYVHPKNIGERFPFGEKPPKPGSIPLVADDPKDLVVIYEDDDLLAVSWISRWWFQTFLIFTPTWGNDPM